MTATSGPTSLPDPFAYFDPATSSWRTSQLSFLSDSDSFSPTWPSSGMTRGGHAYELPTLEPATVATDSSLLPTPCAQEDGKTPAQHANMRRNMPGGGRSTVTSLSVMAKQSVVVGRMDNALLPTPTKGDAAWGVTGGGSMSYGITLTDAAKATAGFPMFREAKP